MGLLGRIFGRSEQRESAKAPKVATVPLPPMPNLAVRTPETLPVAARVIVSEPVRTPAAEAPAAVPAPATPREVEAEPYNAEPIKRVVLPRRELSILDLRSVQSTRTRIVGSAYWVTDSGRSKYGGTEYLLVREPKNKWDQHAVAVYGKGRKVGHLSAAKAAAFAPFLDALGYDGYTVGGASVSVNSSRLWVDLPSIPALRKFARDHVAP